MEAPSPPPFTNDDSWSDLNRRDDDRRDIANNENLNLVEVEEGWSANSNSNANEAFEDEGGESAEGEGTDVLDGEGTLSLSAHYRRSFPDDSASGSAGGGGGSGALKTVHSGRSLSSSHSLQSQSPSQSQSQSQSHGSAPAAAATGRSLAPPSPPVALARRGVPPTSATVTPETSRYSGGISLLFADLCLFVFRLASIDHGVHFLLTVFQSTGGPLCLATLPPDSQPFGFFRRNQSFQWDWRWGLLVGQQQSLVV